jgi:uncharacterized membrane-anchored protein
MSISSLTTNAAERDVGRQGATPGKVELLVSAIPTEMVTGYLAAVAAVVATTSDQNPKLGLRWLLLAGFAVLTPVAVWSLWSAKLRPDDPLRKRRAPFLEMVTATLAFLVWAFALPDSPITLWSAYDVSISPVIVIVGAILLTLIAPLLQRPAKDPGQAGSIRQLRRLRKAIGNDELGKAAGS